MYSVLSHSPDARSGARWSPQIIIVSYMYAWRSVVPGRLLQGVSSVGTGSEGAVLGRLHVHEEVRTGQDDT